MKLSRKLVLWGAKLPIDVAVEPIRMRCYLRDNNSEKKFVFLPRRFDKRERQLLLESLPRDGVFVDIGANVGLYTLTAATHLSSQGRIIALEPNPPVLERLYFNLQATRAGRREWPTIDVLPLGVADVPGEFELYLDPQNLGNSTIASPESRRTDNFSQDGTGEKTVRIPCQPLLTILEEQSVTKIDALKIDIEGAEDIALVPYLEAAPQSQLPQLILLENSEHLWKRDLVGTLAKRGYTIQMRSRLNTVYRCDRD
ncbi:FkbM family methyltransferase [bacterium]|nr:FkbM family methyltransferase [bacterium]